MTEMDRRAFLKALGIGAVGIGVASHVLAGSGAVQGATLPFLAPITDKRVIPLPPIRPNALPISIISSIISADDVQTDGRRHIREEHTDNLGDIYPAFYLGEANVDANAKMLARVPFIEAQIAEAATEVIRQGNEDSGDVKLDTYVAGLSDEDAKRIIGYTEAELVIVRKR